MTNEEAKTILLGLSDNPLVVSEYLLEALDLAIKALEQQPCEDCISKTELLARIDAERKHLLDIKMDGAEHIVVHHARRIIEDMPSVTPSYNSVNTELKSCNDCISRQEIIDEIDRYIEKAQSTGTKDDFISFEELIVKQLPSVTSKARWIPCSERLPEEEEEIVLITIDSRYYPRPYVDMGFYKVETKKWYWINTEGINPSIKVIGWMPLPTPI